MPKILRDLLFALGLTSGLAAQQVTSWDLPAMLRRQVQLGWLWRSPPPGERCVQFSSYDRTSDLGPGAHAAWYANNDRGQYLRIEERSSGKEHVMVDVAGPGCLTRLWSANPTGTLHFDVDGDRVWTVDFALLCSGKMPGLPEPLAGMRARGGNIYLPILFGSRLQISSSQPDLYYLADVLRWPEGAEVVPFHPSQLKQHSVAVARAADTAGAPVVRQGDAAGRIAAGSLVQAMSIGVDGPKAARLNVLRRARLLVQCGEETTVDVPLLAFFATGPDSQPWRGALLGQREGGAAYSNFPMPFPDGGSIQVLVEGDDLGVSFPITLSVVGDAVESDAMLFRASYHLVRAQPTRPFSEHLVLDARGCGRFVGCSLLVRNPSRLWWGEGDEKFYVDGEARPSWFGTGTEDYFGYAWCDPTTFQAPYHAQVRCDGPNNYGFTQLHRTHVLDSVPFQKSFRFDLERWHWVEDTTIDYETVAYWYGSPGARSGLPPVPSVDQRAMSPLPPPKFLAVDGAIEGESLRVLSCSGGTNLVQNLMFFEGKFSRDAQRWWIDGKVGDTLALAVPVPEDGRYRVRLVMTRADDFAKVQVSLGELSLAAPFDGYAVNVQPSAPLVLGEADFPAGEATLTLTIVGKNPAAKERLMVGLDYLVLERLR